jgi:hypothetical protein
MTSIKHKKNKTINSDEINRIDEETSCPRCKDHPGWIFCDDIIGFIPCDHDEIEIRKIHGSKY